MGSYLRATVATGDHFACSLPIPLIAIASNLSFCPGPILMIMMPLSCDEISSSSSPKCTGNTSLL